MEAWDDREREEHTVVWAAQGSPSCALSIHEMASIKGNGQQQGDYGHRPLTSPCTVLWAQGSDPGLGVC